MPAYDHADQSPRRSIVVNFRNQDDVDRFAALIEQEISATKKSVWFPKAGIERYAEKRWVSDRPLLPKYPIYVISKGRWEKPLTARQLEALGVPYHIVVEPQEYEDYSRSGRLIDPEKILTLPFSNLGQGSTPARNWIWSTPLGPGQSGIGFWTTTVHVFAVSRASRRWPNRAWSWSRRGCSARSPACLSPRNVAAMSSKAGAQRPCRICSGSPGQGSRSMPVSCPAIRLLTAAFAWQRTLQFDCGISRSEALA